MPVFSAVITSKRARRGRTLTDSSPSLEESDTRRLRRRIEKAAGSQNNSRTASPQLTGESPQPSSTTSSSAPNMSAWQADEQQTPTPTGKGMSLSHNPSINESGSVSPPKSPTKSDVPSGVERSFQRRRSFNSRKRDVDEILSKHPHKVPIIIERARKEKSLTLLDKSKFLVPEELTMSQLTTIIRRRLQLSDTQAFYLIINRRTMVSASMTLAEVYRNDRDADGFLYIVYASQEMFG